jgi:predicted Zn finger-like uncharacterized protein
MQITCPHCGYSREVSDDQIPAGEVRVTCPLCSQRFPFDHPDGGQGPAPEPDSGPKEAEPRPGPPLPPSPPPAPENNREAGTAACRPAGFWIRAVAAMIDSVLVALLQAGLGLLFTTVVYRLQLIFDQGLDLYYGLPTLTLLYSLVTGVAYYVFFTGHCGQTPGKMVLRIKVVREDGGAIGYGRAFVRETLGKFLSAALFGLGYLMVAFTARKQGLHDKLVGSLVIKTD